MNIEQQIEFDKIKETWMNLAVTAQAKERIKETSFNLSSQELSIAKILISLFSVSICFSSFFSGSLTLSIHLSFTAPLLIPENPIPSSFCPFRLLHVGK